MMKSVGFNNISILPAYLDQHMIEEAIGDRKDVIGLKTISLDDVYKAVYNAKITAHKPS